MHRITFAAAVAALAGFGAAASAQSIGTLGGYAHGPLPAPGPGGFTGGIDTNVVYDNGQTELGFFVGSREQERGDGVTLAGTDRILTGITLIFFSQAAFEADLTVRIWEGGNSGASEPGALIWESDTLRQEPLASGAIDKHFAIPNVLVPDEITWTIQFANVSGDPALNVGPRFYDPPVVGSSEEHAWLREGSSWTRQVFGLGGPDSNFGAVITAVPTPASLTLFGLGGLVALRRRR